MGIMSRRRQIRSLREQKIIGVMAVNRQEAVTQEAPKQIELTLEESAPREKYIPKRERKSKQEKDI